MNMLGKMIKHAREEIRDAEKYIDCAIKHKGTNSDMANVYYALSQEELQHFERIREQIIREVDSVLMQNRNESDEKHIEARAMQMVWEYENEELLNECSSVRAKTSSYK